MRRTALFLAALLFAGSAPAQYARNVTAEVVNVDGSDATATYGTIPAPSGCAATNVLFFGTPVTVGPKCDTRLTFDPATGRFVVGPGNLLVVDPTFGVSAPALRIGSLFTGAIPFIGANGLVEADTGLKYDDATNTATTGRVLSEGGTAAAPPFSSVEGPDDGMNVGNGVVELVINGVRQFHVTQVQTHVASTQTFGWTSRGLMSSPALYTVQLGPMSSSTPNGQMLQAQGGAGISNMSGGDLTLSAGRGTGLATTTAEGRRGDWRARTQVRGTTGSAVDAVGADRLVFAGQRVTLTESSATPTLQYGVPSNSIAGGTFYYTIRANDATNYQAIRGSVSFVVVNKAGTLTATLGTPAELVASSSGTLTNTVTLTTGTNSITLNLDAVSSLTQTTLYANASALLDGNGVAITQ